MNLALESFADLLEYPNSSSEEIKALASMLVNNLNELGKGTAANGVRAFLDKITGLSKENLEETYTATFELNPVSYLYAGYLLFGESYKRGALLVELKSKLLEHKVTLGTEVPDYIPALLRLLGRQTLGAEHATELQSLCLHPALTKMVEGIKNQDNPYSSLLIATKDFLVTTEASL